MLCVLELLCMQALIVHMSFADRPQMLSAGWLHCITDSCPANVSFLMRMKLACISTLRNMSCQCMHAAGLYL